MTPLLQPTMEPSALRRVCGLFVTGVTVVTAGAAGFATGTTVNSFTSVSLAPPLVLFCLHRKARLNETLRESGSFAVNVLAGHHERVARTFSSGRAAANADVRFKWTATGAPIIEGALAYLACKIFDVHPGGDHAIVVGEVLEAGTGNRQRPLIFFDGALNVLDDMCPRWPILDG